MDAEEVGTDDVWCQFFPMLKETAQAMQCREIEFKDDGGPAKAEIVTKAGIRFYVCMFDDEFELSYIRFLSLIKQLESEDEAVSMLHKARTLGGKIYLDDRLLGDDSWAVVYAIDYPLIAGYPSTDWFSYVLLKLDRYMLYLKGEL